MGACLSYAPHVIENDDVQPSPNGDINADNDPRVPNGHDG